MLTDYYAEHVWYHSTSNYYIRKDGIEYDVRLHWEYDTDELLDSFETFEEADKFINERIKDEKGL